MSLDREENFNYFCDRQFYAHTDTRQIILTSNPCITHISKMAESEYSKNNCNTQVTLSVLVSRRKTKRAPVFLVVFGCGLVISYFGRMPLWNLHLGVTTSLSFGITRNIFLLGTTRASNSKYVWVGWI